MVENFGGFYRLQCPTQGIYINFGAPQARKNMELTPPTQGIYIDFSAPQARNFSYLTPLTQATYIDFGAPQAKKNRELTPPNKGFTSILARRRREFFHTLHRYTSDLHRFWGAAGKKIVR